MWINKQAYAHLQELNHVAIRDLSQRLERAERQLIDREATIERFRNVATQARVEAAAAKAYSDGWRLQVNTLTATNAALLSKLLPDLDLKIPRVEHAPSVDPALDFEDMGDTAAGTHVGGRLRADGTEIPTDPTLVAGDANMFLDPEEAIEGVRGTVVRSAPGV